MALIEAIAASIYAHLTDGEKTGFSSSKSLFADPSLRECLPPTESGLYNLQQMTDVFSAYRKHLDICDLDPKTKTRYWEVVSSFRKWLGKKRPDATTAQEFLADLINYLTSPGRA